VPIRAAGRVAAIAVLGATLWNAQPIALAGIHVYQRSLSPLAAHAGIRCRFTPTCSRYAETAIERDGVVRGGWRAMKRIARCGPWTPMGTRDDP
jgi:putative membrane protein insertion efficiency factor